MKTLEEEVHCCGEEDISRVNYIMGEESVYKSFPEDVQNDNFRYRMGELLIRNPYITVLMPHKDIVFVSYPITEYIQHCSIMALPESRGEAVTTGIKKCWEWMKKNTKVETIVIWTTRECRHMRWAFGLIGFKRFGEIRCGGYWNGKLTDYLLYQITRENGEV